jgi:hypothetical protein
MGNAAEIRERFPEKPLVVCSIGDRGFLEDLDEAVGPHTPLLSSPEIAARTLAALYRYKAMRDSK